MLNSNKKGDRSSRAMIYKFTCTAVSIFFTHFQKETSILAPRILTGPSQWSPSHPLGPLLVLLVCHAHSCLTRMRAFQQQWCLSDCGSWSEIPRSLGLPCWHGYISVSSHRLAGSSTVCQKRMVFGVIYPIQPDTAQDLLGQLFSFISLQSGVSTLR